MRSSVEEGMHLDLGSYLYEGSITDIKTVLRYEDSFEDRIILSKVGEMRLPD